MKNDGIDRMIETTLTRDAERIRSRFASVPNAGLASKLTLANAPKGLLATLSAKLLLVAGTALVAGATVYLWPTVGRWGHLPNSGRDVRSTRGASVSPAVGRGAGVSPAVGRGAGVSPAVGQPSPAVQVGGEVIHIQNSSATAPATFTEAPGTHAKPHKNWLHLDDGGSKNVKTITNGHYEPPLK